MKGVTDNRKFCQTVKPNFADKTLKEEKITLIDGGKIAAEAKDLGKKFKDQRFVKLTVQSLVKKFEDQSFLKLAVQFYLI